MVEATLFLVRDASIRVYNSGMRARLATRSMPGISEVTATPDFGKGGRRGAGPVLRGGQKLVTSGL